MEMNIDFNNTEIQDLSCVLLKEALLSKRAFICDECEEIYLKENKASVQSNNMAICVNCAKEVLDSHKDQTNEEGYIQKQITSIMGKISDAEKEYNELIQASRKGISWESEIESRKNRIQSLKRNLNDWKKKSSH
ncbi:MAG: hypothetical protein COA79_00235 [Planctomycetota bacterium]|nr:MAG: hypothetical protein COA79_00235 [Planctomycetota bacterium]